MSRTIRVDAVDARLHLMCDTGTDVVNASGPMTAANIEQMVRQVGVPLDGAPSRTAFRADSSDG